MASPCRHHSWPCIQPHSCCCTAMADCFRGSLLSGHSASRCQRIHCWSFQRVFPRISSQQALSHFQHSLSSSEAALSRDIRVDRLRLCADRYPVAYFALGFEFEHQVGSACQHHPTCAVAEGSCPLLRAGDSVVVQSKLVCCREDSAEVSKQRCGCLNLTDWL